MAVIDAAVIGVAHVAGACGFLRAVVFLRAPVQGIVAKMGLLPLGVRLPDQVAVPVVDVGPGA